jgi:hypothetical protein
MSLFKNRFNTLLEQEVKEPEAEVPTPEEALKAELDPGTDPAAMGATPFNPDQNIDAVKNAARESQKVEVETWVAKIQEFVTFLNDPTGPSVNNKLHDAGCDTMFEKIASSEAKKISRIAVELSGLAQSLNGFLIAGDS